MAWHSDGATDVAEEWELLADASRELPAGTTSMEAEVVAMFSAVSFVNQEGSFRRPSARLGSCEVGLLARFEPQSPFGPKSEP